RRRRRGGRRAAARGLPAGRLRDRGSAGGPRRGGHAGARAGMIAGMRRVNVNTADLEYDDRDPEGYRAGGLKVSEDLGAKLMAGSVYEVPPGQANCPYHYEFDEEWLLVLAGTITVRHPTGE